MHPAGAKDTTSKGENMDTDTDLMTDDVLAVLLGDASVDDLAELDVDPIQMPVAKSSVVWTVTVHC
jgi:hypothetical protein